MYLPYHYLPGWGGVLTVPILMAPFPHGEEDCGGQEYNAVTMARARTQAYQSTVQHATH